MKTLFKPFVIMLLFMLTALSGAFMLPADLWHTPAVQMTASVLILGAVTVPVTVLFLRGSRLLAPTVYALFAVLFVMTLAPNLLYAGVIDFLTDQVLGAAMVVILAAVRLVWGQVWQSRAKEFLDILKVYIAARRQDSEGGDGVSAAEWREIAEELVQFIMSIMPASAASKLQSQARSENGTWV